MNITILGAGAVGGFLGAKLQNSGNDVTFLVRKNRYEQLAREGLKIQSMGQNIRLSVKAVTDDSEIGHSDALIVAVKNFGLNEAIKSIKNLSQEGAAVVSFLNGIDQMEEIRRFVPDERIAGGVLHLQASFDGEKIVQQGLEPAVILGSPSSKPQSAVHSLYEAFAKSGLKTSVSDDILVDMWKKYIFITILSSLTGVCRAPIGPILRNQNTYSLFEEITSEVVQVSKAVLPHATALSVSQALNQIKNLPETMTASMARDVERGLPTEVEYIQGYLVKKAQDLGLSVPTLTFCYKVLKLRENGLVTVP